MREKRPQAVSANLMMFTLSDLLRFRLIDRGGEKAKLRDLAVDLAVEPYPVVTDVCFDRPGREMLFLPWAEVHGLDRRAQTFRVADLTAGYEPSPEAGEEAVLLKRDILDTLVLDLEQRRAARANDLWLAEENSQLVLRGANTSWWAVLHRLSHRFFGRGHGRQLYDWRYVEFLHGDPQAPRRSSHYEHRIEHLPAGEIARLSDALPYLHAAELLGLLPESVAADTLKAMAPERQVQIFEELDEALATQLVSLMRPNRAADLLGRLAPEDAERLLGRMPRVRADQVIDLLRYPEDTAGGIMTNDVATIRVGLNASEALRLLRERLRQPDFVHFIFVVDDEARRQLVGVVSLRTLVVADPERAVGELMNRYMVVLDALEPADVAAERVITAQLAALPVVGRHGRVLGAVTVDAALERIAPNTQRAHVPKVFS